MATSPAPPPLLCGSAQEAVAHTRAQLQLQAAVFQLALEGSFAAPLLPAREPQQAANGDGEVAWERWLAQCRLAHLLLTKGAWNRLVSVAEVQVEEQEGA